MSVGDYVAEGRCPCCGHALMTWTPGTIVRAARRWGAKHGRPPRAHEWHRGTPDHPARTTACYVFGSWNQMLRAAGFKLRESGRPLQWTKGEVANAMLRWLLREGRWPVYRNWLYASDDGSRPSAATVLTLFGSWNNARRYAGWRPATPPERPPRKCTGCGGPLDERTPGCHTCSARHSFRRRQQEGKEVAHAV